MNVSHPAPRGGGAAGRRTAARPRPRWTVLSALLLLAGAAAAQGGPPGRSPAPPVRVAQVVEADLAPTLPVPGSVVSRDDTRMAAETAGRLVELAEVGTRVSAGEVVARIDDALLRAQRAQIIAEKRRAESRLAFLTRETERLARLAETNAAAERELDDVRSQREVAREDIAVIDARLAQNRVDLDRSVMRAPFDGQVTQRFLNPGERVAVGDQVVRIIGRERIEVIAQATVGAARFLYVGGTVRIADGTGRRGTGEVRAIVPFGDSSRHMYEVRIDVPADDWLVAQAVTLELPVAVPERVLAVPRDALVLRRESTYVMRLDDDDTAERVDVTPGLSAGALIAVDGDLSAGDRVVVRGAERLAPGTTVEVLPEPASAPAVAPEVAADG